MNAAAPDAVAQAASGPPGTTPITGDLAPGLEGFDRIAQDVIQRFDVAGLGLDDAAVDRLPPSRTR